MTSRLLSQIFNQNSTSIYETLQEHDEMSSGESDGDDLEERAGMMPIRTNPTYRDDDDEPGDSPYDLEQRSPRGASMGASRLEQSRPFFSQHRHRSHHRQLHDYKDEDDNVDVPASLLFEEPAAQPHIEEDQLAHRMPRRPSSEDGSKGLPGVLARPDDDRLRPDDPWDGQAPPSSRPAIDQTKNSNRRGGRIDPKERAMWKWANVENLDNFLNDVYLYFIGKGIWNMLLVRLLSLLTLAFVVTFPTYLTICIDYKAIHQHTSNSLADITIPHCMSRMSGWATFLLWAISIFWVYKLTMYLLDLRRVWDIYQFYTYLLEIPDSDMQTISWQEIVGRLMVLRDANPNTSDKLRRRNYNNSSKQRMDAHDIANRLMRRENYLIALFNKEVLDLTIPLPLLRNRGGMLTRTLEWNLSQCILDFVFNDQGQIRTLFLKDSNRREFSEGLRKRFIFAGWMSFFMAPFMVSYFLLLFLMRNLHDFIKTPARIGHRQYTPLAEWKFREFNELWHLFDMRLTMSYPAAEEYVNQFPKEKTSQAARFVSFVASSLLGVLVIGTMIDYELIGGFEVAPGVTVLSSIAILSSIVAVSRGMLSEDHSVYDPEWSIRNVIGHTHYMPDHWKDKLHSDDVKREFMSLYTLKITIFIDELLSVIFTPFVLWFSLPKCADRIIDFFREFTVHVDGVGYVCSFAEFNFQKTDRQGVEDLKEEYFATKDNKMLASYLGFMDQYHAPNGRGGTAGRRGGPPVAHSSLGTRTPAHFRHIQEAPQPQSTARNLAKSMHRDSPMRMQASLMRSSLLDIHHQPTAQSTRHPRTPVFPVASVKEEEQEDDQVPAEFLGPHGQRFRSNLGESFESGGLRSTLREDESVGGAAGGGVLDLLNQFVGAAQGEGAGRTTIV